MKKQWMVVLGICLVVGAGALLVRFGAPAAPQGAPEPPPAEPPAPSAPGTPPAEPPGQDPRDAAVQAVMDGLTEGQKVGQLFFARCPDGDEAAQATQYQPGGYILFARDFAGRTPDTLRAMLDGCNRQSAVPMLFGVDEEGGTVCRVSRFAQYRAAGKFPSPQALFKAGGMEAVGRDAAEKAALLRGLGLNVNLAPVCDVSTDPGDYMYARAFGKDAGQTAAYASAVVRETQAGGVGCVLKHFPGYGDNADTHTGVAVDNRPLSTFEKSDFLPFSAGIEAGAGGVLVSHNIVPCMDGTRPASLSPAVHAALRDGLGFGGVILTDDLAMDAVRQYTGGASAAVLALQAGNDMLISSDLPTQYAAVLAALQDGTLDSGVVDRACARVLGWKYDLGLL